MEVSKQLALGILVCPNSKSRLALSSEHQLTNEFKNRQYPLINGTVPILLLDEIKMVSYARSNEKMNIEYSDKEVKKNSFFDKIKSKISPDYRTKASKEALESLFENISDEKLAISIGGGPARINQKVTNLNIGPFPNVDVVADAHCLPYADNSVDIIYCEAVLEHLHTPFIAVQEMARVLKQNGKIYACTPFLQPYHGYPNHYQGFTLTGHVNLFESAGLKVIKSGSCVGPVYTVVSMISVFIETYVQSQIGRALKFAWGCLSVFIKPLDILFGNKDNAHIMASTTYLIACKHG